MLPGRLGLAHGRPPKLGLDPGAPRDLRVRLRHLPRLLSVRPLLPLCSPWSSSRARGTQARRGSRPAPRPPGAHSWLQRPAKNLATPRGASRAGCGSAQATGDDAASDSFLLGAPLPQPAQRPSHTLQPLPLTRAPLAWLNWLGFSLPQRLLLWATAPRVPRLPGTSIIATRPALVAVLRMCV